MACCATSAGKDERYRQMPGVLARFGYKRLKKPDKGLILRDLERTTGYSWQQIARLVWRWKAVATPATRDWRRSR